MLMSDMRLSGGLRVARTAGMIGLLAAPLAMIQVAEAATITRTQTWNDGEPAFEFPMTIQEGGVTYARVSQTNPVRSGNSREESYTFPEATANPYNQNFAGSPSGFAEWPAVPTDPLPVNRNGYVGSQPFMRFRWTFHPTHTTRRTIGSYSDEQAARSNEAADRSKAMPVTRGDCDYDGNLISYVGPEKVSDYDDGSGARPKWRNVYEVCDGGNWELKCWYASTTLTKTVGANTWSRSATYQSVDPNNPTPTVSSEAEARRLAEDMERQRAQAEEQALRSAQTQANDTIASVEGLLAAGGDKVPEDLRSQTQQKIDELRLVASGTDVTAINDSRAQLLRLSDEVTAALQAAGDAEALKANRPEAGDPNTNSKDSENSDDEKKKQGTAAIGSGDSDNGGDTQTGRGGMNLVPLAIGGVIALVAGGAIVGVVLAKGRKNKKTIDDPNAVPGAFVATADGGAVIPGVVPITDTTSKLVAFINNGEQARELLEWDATISPADNIPTLAEIPINENGFVPVWVDDNGEAMIATDEAGNPILQVDENGQPIQATDEAGNPQYDEAGNPIPQPEYVIPGYMLVLPEEALANAVSDQLLVYSSDGQEIYRGPVAPQTLLDTARLYEVLNGTAGENKIDVSQEVFSYMDSLDEIQSQNQELTRQFEEQQRLQEQMQQEQMQQEQALGPEGGMPGMGAMPTEAPGAFSQDGAQPVEYGDQPVYDQGGEYGAQPAYDPNTDFGDQPVYDQGGEYGTQPAYDPNTDFGDQPTYDQGGEYGAQPAYDPNTDFGDQPVYDQGGEYGAQPAYDPNTDFGDQLAYDQGGEYGAQPAYDQGYDQSGEYGAQPAYDQGYDQGGDYGAQPAYDQGYDQGGDYGAQPAYDQGYDQGGDYGAQPSGYDDFEDYNMQALNETAAGPIGVPEDSYGGYEQGSYGQGGYDQGAYEQGNYGQGAYEQGGYDSQDSQPDISGIAQFDDINSVLASGQAMAQNASGAIADAATTGFQDVVDEVRGESYSGSAPYDPNAPYPSGPRR